jgi:hypothetical protein
MVSPMTAIIDPRLSVFALTSLLLLLLSLQAD